MPRVLPLTIEKWRRHGADIKTKDVSPTGPAKGTCIDRSIIGGDPSGKEGDSCWRGRQQRRRGKKKKASLDNIYFPLQPHTKLPLNRMNDLLAKIKDLLAPCIPIIHEHKRLLRVAPCIALPVSLPAALLDEPTCCQLCMFIPRGESSNLRV